MTDRDALKRYIEENTYNEWTLSEWCDAENDWADYPEDSEEYRKLLLLRKKHDRMMADEERRKNYLRLMKQREEVYENEEKYSNILSFKSKKVENQYNAYINKNLKRKIKFEDFLEKYKRKNGIISDADVCRGANLSPDVLNKIKKEINYNVQRDYLWAIAISLKLETIDEVEELFKSCNQSIDGKYKLTEAEIERELTIEFIILNKMTITEANKELREHHMGTLGNADIY